MTEEKALFEIIDCRISFQYKNWIYNAQLPGSGRSTEQFKMIQDNQKSTAHSMVQNAAAHSMSRALQHTACPEHYSTQHVQSTTTRSIVQNTEHVPEDWSWSGTPQHTA